MNTADSKSGVAIIGCGQIGAMWDAPDSQGPFLTHAGAFAHHPQAELLAFCDSDAARAEAARARWSHVAPQAQAFADVAQMMDALQGRAQIVVLAAASQARAALLGPILEAKPRLLVIEKPLATTLAESRTMVQRLAAHGQTVLVNYSRHWDSALQALLREIHAGRWGRVQRLQGWYGKGISNNGSHMIDLARQLLQARVSAVRAAPALLPAAEADWSEGRDPALDAQLRLQNARGEWQLDMLATDQRHFTCFALNIMLEGGCIEISQGGRAISVREVINDPDYSSYRIPGAPQPRTASTLDALPNLVREALNFVQGKSCQLSCTAGDAHAVALAVDALKQSAASDQRWRTPDTF